MRTQKSREWKSVFWNLLRRIVSGGLIILYQGVQLAKEIWPEIWRVLTNKIRFSGLANVKGRPTQINGRSPINHLSCDASDNIKLTSAACKLQLWNFSILTTDTVNKLQHIISFSHFCCVTCVAVKWRVWQYWLKVQF